MKVSTKGVKFVGGWEGFRSCPYRDAVGVWTIGYGETSNVGPNTPCISERAARANLRERLNRDFLPAIPQDVRDRLKQHEVDALTSFVYNVGTGALGSSTGIGSKLRKRRARLYAFRKRAYKTELPKWVRAGGSPLAGLIKRRNAEVALACKGDYSGRP